MQRVDATKSPTRSRVASLADIATESRPLAMTAMRSCLGTAVRD